MRETLRAAVLQFREGALAGDDARLEVDDAEPAADAADAEPAGADAASEADGTSGAPAGYDYLLNLRERDLLKSSVPRFERERDSVLRALAKLREARAESPFPGASLWLADISALLARIDEGARTDWRFGRRARE